MVTRSPIIREASKIQISSLKTLESIHIISLNNLSMSIDAITSEGMTLISIQSNPDILPDTGGLPYALYGGDSIVINLYTQSLMNNLPDAFLIGNFIDEIDPYVNFTVHVTGMPHGCEGPEEWWDEEQQVVCPDKVANHRTDYYQNFLNDALEW